jgi:hypothetical protein
MAWISKNIVIVGYCQEVCPVWKTEYKNYDVYYFLENIISGVWYNHFTKNIDKNKIKIIKCKEPYIPHINTFNGDFEDHVINKLFNYFLSEKMYNEAFVAGSLINNDLSGKTQLIFSYMSKLIKRICSKLDNKKSILFVPFKLLNPKLHINLQTSIPNVKFTFDQKLTPSSSYNEIELHAEMVYKIMYGSNNKITSGVITDSIYRHLLSIIGKIWILEMMNIKSSSQLTKIKIIHMIMKYLYEHDKIESIIDVWKLFGHDAVIESSEKEEIAYIHLYLSKYFYTRDKDLSLKHFNIATKLNASLLEMCKITQAPQKGSIKS